LTADPDRSSDDVRAVEQSLRQNPAGLALFLHDQLNLDDPKQALAVLKNERLSNLVRCLALASLLADLILNKDLKFHRQVLKDLDNQERDMALPALRRPTEQWVSLTMTYRRAISVFELMAVLSKTANALKVAEAKTLEFKVFDQA
jgi:hypothetical protein